MLDLDGATLTISDALEVSRGDRTVRLAERAAEAVRASRRLKQELIDREIPIYGVTTGFGDSAHRQISPDKTGKLQQNILRFMGVGTGPIAPPEVARVTMLLRANCLSKGNSGVRVELIEHVLDLLNHDVTPFIPERGSCGASGDLAPLSYVGRALAGDGDVLYDGVPRHAADVLTELGLDPFLLEAKEGLALTNGTSFMSAFACLAVGASRELADLADLMTAMASEALLGNRGHFNAFLFDEAKPHPGMVTSARHIRELLAESGLAADSDELFAGGMEGAGFLELDRQVQDQLLDPLRAPRDRPAARRAGLGRAVGLGRDQLLRRQPAVQRRRRPRRERRQLLRRPHRAGDGLAQGRAGQPVRPHRPPDRPRRRREVQPRPDRQPHPAL